MGKAIRNYLILLSAVVIVMALTVFSSADRKVDWEQTYDANSKQPYGLYIFGEQLKHFFSKKIDKISYTPYEYLRRNQQKGEYNYIFTTEGIDEVSLKKILSDVRAGSQALFLNENYGLMDTLKIDIDYELTVDDINLQLNSTSYDKQIYINPERVYLRVNYFTQLDKERDKALGYVFFSDGRKIRKKINFVEVPYGKGKFFLYLGPPMAFTNYFLKESQEARSYVATVLSYLPQNRPTVWFVPSTQGEGALSFIMSQSQLRIAWRLMLLGFLLYLIFRGKRQQRIIPVIEKPKNTTIEFAQSISSLYYQERDATDMVRKKITYFLDQVRQRYYLDTQQINEDFATKLANKSGKDRDLVQQIVGTIIHFEQTQQAQEETLTQLDKWIDEFWNIH
ncbi:hypothetical protein [Capnocytophaga granulosa]|uniref:hypothetical protein n=1 Tax=Capnocytophaga granulosa TaxID=45242 RepID=UPI0023F108D9|nr:hypothetical protein [Capnocytophaga granulosa]